LDDESNPLDLRSNPSQWGLGDDVALARGPITKIMARKIQEG